MTSLCISGKQLAHKKEEELALISSSQPKKKIVVIMVGDNPVSKQYVERKRAVAERIGVLLEVRE
jgi:5,10-methylene-tetrahydrofolate dehydrogenase/methenyl tetrahydrofolate cyclohydrolase